jgi:hypothetical protein
MDFAIDQKSPLLVSLGLKKARCNPESTNINAYSLSAVSI